MQVKPGFKRTDFGLIPVDWDIKQIGDLKPFVTSGSRGWAEFYAEYGALFLRITNLSRSSIYLELDDIRFVRLQRDNAEANRTELRDGDILISITADIGIVGYVSSTVPKPAYINQHIALVRFDQSQTNSQFISYFLASVQPQRAFRALTDAGAKAGMNLTTIQKVPLALPAIPEQEAIAAALSDVDSLIGAQEQLIAKKRDLKQATMQQLLTQWTRLPGFSSKWKTLRLEEITYCLDNLRVPLNDTQRQSMKGDYPYCGANGVLDFINDYMIDDEIMLIAEDGGYFDEYARRPIAYQMSGRCWVNNHAHILKAKIGTCQDFVFHSLVHKNILRYLASGTRSKLNKSEMYKIEIDVPPDEKEQAAIATVLSDMDAELAALEQKRDKTKELKQGMMQELLTGRIRLV